MNTTNQNNLKILKDGFTAIEKGISKIIGAFSKCDQKTQQRVEKYFSIAKENCTSGINLCERLSNMGGERGKLNDSQLKSYIKQLDSTRKNIIKHVNNMPKAADFVTVSKDNRTKQAKDCDQKISDAEDAVNNAMRIAKSKPYDFDAQLKALEIAEKKLALAETSFKNLSK